MHLFNADCLACEDLAEVDLFAAHTDAGDHNGFVVQGVIEVGQSLIRARGRLIDLRGALHAQSLVRALLVENLEEVIEAGLLLQEIGGSGFGGFFKVKCMRS